MPQNGLRGRGTEIEGLAVAVAVATSMQSFVVLRCDCVIDLLVLLWAHNQLKLAKSYYGLLKDGIGRLGHDPPRGLSADWWVLTTADAAGTNGLTSGGFVVIATLGRRVGDRSVAMELKEKTLLSVMTPMTPPLRLLRHPWDKGEWCYSRLEHTRHFFVKFMLITTQSNLRIFTSIACAFPNLRGTNIRTSPLRVRKLIRCHSVSTKLVRRAQKTETPHPISYMIFLENWQKRALLLRLYCGVAPCIGGCSRDDFTKKSYIGIGVAIQILPGPHRTLVTEGTLLSHTLTISVARAAGLPHTVLHHQLAVPVRLVRRTPEDIRKSSPILRRAERVDTDVVRARLLRELSGEALVGAVQAAALARHAGALHLSRHSRSGRDGTADAAQYRAVHDPGIRDHVAAGVAASQAPLPNVAACRRL
ncbi:hypothetical protein evm_004617, partial [Chilo suppressalis]